MSLDWSRGVLTNRLVIGCRDIKILLRRDLGIGGGGGSGNGSPSLRFQQLFAEAPSPLATEGKKLAGDVMDCKFHC